MPWAMQLVVYRDRHEPARQVDVCEATARAVVALLDDARSAEGGPWHDAVQHWVGGHIRKLVRRADGKRWDDVQLLEGVSVEQAGPADFGVAAARAFVPGPEGPQPKAIDKLQIAGTNFPDEGVSLSVDALAVVEVSPLVEMTSGKMAAQCAHAAQRLYESAGTDGDPESTRASWRADGFRLQVDFPSVEQWHRTPRPVSIIDAGFTELGGLTETTRAYWRH